MSYLLVAISSIEEWDKKSMEMSWEKSTKATFSESLEAMTNKDSP